MTDSGLTATCLMASGSVLGVANIEFMSIYCSRHSMWGPRIHKNSTIRILEQGPFLLSLLLHLPSLPSSPSMKPSLTPLAPPSVSGSCDYLDSYHMLLYCLILPPVSCQTRMLTWDLSSKEEDHSYQSPLPISLHVLPLFQLSGYLFSVLPWTINPSGKNPV